MTVAFRSDNAVINATAGTSVTVSKPSGTTDGDFLLAFVAELGVGTITAPAGWTLLATQDADSDLRFAAYRKTASGEGASWTWTLGSSVRNWGWVGAYTGVNTTDPVVAIDGNSITSAGTSFSTEAVRTAIGGPHVAAAAAYRTASGTATTWSVTSGTEQLDHSTNAGSGSDITGAVYDSANLGPGLAFTTMTASQTQTKCATFAVSLRPYFVLPAAPYDLLIEMAFGADPDGDPTTWTWTDISRYVRQADGGGIGTRTGRSGEGALSDPTRIVMTLDNRDGRFTPGNPTGAYYPNIRRNTPVRVSIKGVGSGIDYELTQAQVDEWPAGWSTGDDDRWVDIVASGLFRRWQSTNTPVLSVLRRLISGDDPVAYWPMEDESGAATLAAASDRTAPMQINGLFSMAASDVVAGSAPLPLLADGASGTGSVPVYPAASAWTIEAVMQIPVAVATTTVLLEWRSAGTLVAWQLVIVPGAPDTFNIRAYNSSGTMVLDDAVSVTESELYGPPILVVATAVQNGADVDYTGTFHLGNGSGTGNTGTVSTQAIGNIGQVTVKATSNLDGATIGHVAVFASDIAGGIGFSWHYQGITGHAGERPADRMLRLTTEEGIPFDYVGVLALSTGASMGAQPIASRLDILRECEAVDGGILTDYIPAFNTSTEGNAYPAVATGGVFLAGLSEMLNRPVDLTIDLDSRQLSPPFAPTYDDQTIANDVTARRVNGSSARVIDVTGPVGIAAEGRYDRDVTVNVQTDNQLPDQASWRVNLGTVAGMRYPEVTFDLRRSPELAQPWLETHRIGTKIQLLNPPTGHPPDPVDLIVVGYQMFINTHEWRVRATCVPAQPFTVFEVEDPVTGRADTAGCVLQAAVDSDDTTLTVCTTTGPLWITSAARSQDFPFNVGVGGEEMTCTALTAVASPTFVAAGTAAHANNASATPGMPASVTTGDLLLVLCAIRNSGTGVPDTPTGYTRLDVFDDTDNVQLFAKIHSGSEVAPTVTFTGGVANATTSAQMAAFRGMCVDLDQLVINSTSQLNASAQDIAVAGLTSREQNFVYLWLGWKQDDWTSTTFAGPTEIGSPTSTTGDDQSLTWYYSIYSAAVDSVASTITVTGGAAAISRSAVVALVGGTQSMTVARSTNTVVKSHLPGEAIGLWKPPVLALGGV